MTPPDWSSFLGQVLTWHDNSKTELLRFTLLQAGGRWSGERGQTLTRILKVPYLNKAPEFLKLWAGFTPLALDDWTRTLKSGSRMAYQMGLEQARSLGFHDVLFLDSEQRILETSTGNLMFRIHGQWITPPLAHGLLPGVARAWLLESGLVSEGSISYHQLKAVDGAAMTNAVRGVVPIVAIDELICDVRPVIELKERLGPRHFCAP